MYLMNCPKKLTNGRFFGTNCEPRIGESAQNFYLRGRITSLTPHETTERRLDNTYICIASRSSDPMLPYGRH